HVVEGDRIGRDDIIRRLVEMQYSRNELEFPRGTYRIRGEIIDIFPAESDQDAIRIELFDDEVDSIRWFDPLTGKMVRKVPRVTIYPKSHYVTPKDNLSRAIETIREELKERLVFFRENDNMVEAERSAQRNRYEMELREQLGHTNGIDTYSRHLSGRPSGEAPPTLFDYIPDAALLIIDESHVTVPQIGAMYKGDRSRKENLVNYGFRLPSALDNRPMKFEEWERIV